MANYQDFPTSMWETLLEYPSESKLLFNYLWSNSNCRPSGLYKISTKTMEIYTGLSAKVIEGAMKGLQGAGKGLPRGLVEYDEITKEIWIKDKLKHIPKLFVNPNMQKSIETDIKVLESPSLRLLFLAFYEGAYKGLGSPPSQDHSQSHIQDQKEKREEREKREKQFVETPTRTNSNQERWSYPPEVQELIQGVIKKKSTSQKK